MQQNMSCPVCGTSTTPDQTFCGACGTKLALITAKQHSSVCPTCASPIKQGQQFCGVCGATVTGESQQQWNTQTQMQPQMPSQSQQQPAAAQPMAGAAPDVAVMSPAPKAQEIAPQAKPLQNKKHGLLLVSVAILQIIGWVIVVGGCIGAVMFAVSDIGTDVFSRLANTGGAGAIAMIIKFIVALIVSLGYGFGLLAFAELCKLLIGIEGNTAHKEEK